MGLHTEHRLGNDADHTEVLHLRSRHRDGRGPHVENRRG